MADSERAQRPRPSPDLLQRLRDGKQQWRQDMASRTIKEKVALLLEMQKRLYPVLSQRRHLRPWERPWEITP
jgi:hypothetical protein